MQINVLCTPRLSKADRAALEKIAAVRNTSVENLVREAVRLYCAECVPTHGRKTRRGR